MLTIGILASGRGSNAQAILDACAAGALDARVAVLIANKPGAQALERAQAAGVEALCLPSAGRDREEYHRELGDQLAARGVELICHAGYMLIAPPSYIDRFRWRVMNIHPSLLPSFPGLHAQRQALAHGVKVSGCTVHFADESLDGGPIILQSAVEVREDDDEASLSARILAHEHRLYPEAIRLFAEGRLQIEGRRVHIRPANSA
ncbi:MAG TPA: phosphoribosylglycinamide formyltransferase [Limnochordia bacterium]|nr:phosphoribosylglycinamide formyltransferase [Limnochordia bacterium]